MKVNECVLGLLIIFFVLLGCVQSDKRDMNNSVISGLNNSSKINQTPPTGCLYNSSTCDENHFCVNNQCILKSGCDYGNPNCDENHTCVGNSCVFKPGCQYTNPACESTQECINNSCITKIMTTCDLICCDASCKDKSIEYVIVTRPMFVDSLKDFVQWKKENGFEVGLLTVDWINQTYPGMTLADKIKLVLHSDFKPRGSRFILLIGDTRMTQVLDLNFRAPPGAHKQMDTLVDPWNVPTGYYYRNLPEDIYSAEEESDVFFADPANWDSDGDGVNDAAASVSADSSNFLLVGRWPVRTVEEVANISNKTIGTSDMTFRKKLLIITDASVIPNDSVPELCLNLETPISPNSWATGGWMRKSSCERDVVGAKRAIFEEGFDYEFRAFNVTSHDVGLMVDETARNSDSMIYEVFHGGHDVGGAVDVSKPFAQIFPLYDSGSCSVGTFYEKDTDSINEAIIKKRIGPVFVTSAEFRYAFYKKIAQGKSIGEAFYASKVIDPQIKEEWISHNYPSWLGSGNGLTLQSSDNLLGDPSLVLYPKNNWYRLRYGVSLSLKALAYPTVVGKPRSRRAE